MSVINLEDTNDGYKLMAKSFDVSPLTVSLPSNESLATYLSIVLFYMKNLMAFDILDMDRIIVHGHL